MNPLEIFRSYIHYLIHPFSTHESFLNPDRFEGESLVKLTAYESLITSWVFVIVNGVFRVITLNFLIVFLLDLASDSEINYAGIINLEEFPAFYLIVISSIVDIIFYPIYGMVIIKFWDFIFKMYGNLMEVSGDISQKSHDILCVYFSSSILKIVPIFGAPIQSLASMVLMYAGIRKQLNASPALSVCIILTPMLFGLALICLITLLVMISL